MKKKLFTATLLALMLTGCAASKTTTTASEGDVINLNNTSTTVNITKGGSYEVTGTCTDSQIIIDANKDDVELIFKDATLNSSSSAPICVLSAGKVSIKLEGESELSNGGSFKNVGTEEVDAVIYSKSDLDISGDGTLKITSPAGHGIVCKDSMEMTGGTYIIEASEDGINTNDALTIDVESLTVKAGDDAVHTDGVLKYISGTADITAAEGLEGTVITIDGGDITISASDDGINAAAKSNDYSPLVEINGGNIDITMGAGDTDGIDSNGDITINGGTISINGQSTIDYDGTATKNGGTLIINGEETDNIPNQFMGGGPMGGGFKGGDFNPDENGDFPKGDFQPGQDGEFPQGDFNRDRDGNSPKGNKERPMDFTA